MFSKTIEKEIVIHKYINVNLIRNICRKKQTGSIVFDPVFIYGGGFVIFFSLQMMTGT